MGTYAFSLYEKLKGLCEMDHIYFNYQRLRLELIDSNGGTRILGIAEFLPTQNGLFRKALFHIQLHKKIPEYELYHIANQNLSLLKTLPKVVTCHDLARIRFSQRHKPFFSILLRGLKNAKLIIAPSKFTKMDIVSYYGLPPARIRVIYEGVDRKIFSPSRDPNIRTELGISDDCFLIMHVGSEIEDKNVWRLVEAVYLLEKKLPIHLLRVGQQSRRIRKKIHKSGLEKNVTYVECVSPKGLAQMYSAANLFVFPSLYEGFGLPLLEAMACGCPVLASNITSIPEVVGDAGILVNPYDVEALSKTMYKMLRDDGLRKEMVQKGLERAHMFSWERTAKETLQVYEDALQ